MSPQTLVCASGAILTALSALVHKTATALVAKKDSSSKVPNALTTALLVSTPTWHSRGAQTATFLATDAEDLLKLNVLSATKQMLAEQMSSSIFSQALEEHASYNVMPGTTQTATYYVKLVMKHVRRVHLPRTLHAVLATQATSYSGWGSNASMAAIQASMVILLRTCAYYVTIHVKRAAEQDQTCVRCALRVTFGDSHCALVLAPKESS